MFLTVGHKPIIIPTYKVDPETGGILTVVFPKTHFGDPLRLTWDHASSFGQNYGDIGWDKHAIKLPSLLQLETIYKSAARGSLPADDFMSSEVQIIGSRKIQTVRCLSFRDGQEVCSAPKATCGTLFILA